MRKIILGLTILLASTIWSVAQADALSIGDSLKQLPALKQGAAWSFADDKLNYLSTLEVLEWNGLALEAGYAGDANATDHKLVAVISGDLLNLKKLGVKVPILDLLDFRLGLYAGYGTIQLGTNEQRDGNNEFDYGASLTAISVKF